MNRKIDEIRIKHYDKKYQNDIKHIASLIYNKYDNMGLEEYINTIDTQNDVSFLLIHEPSNTVCGFSLMRKSVCNAYVKDLSGLEMAFLGIHPNFQGIGIGSYILSYILRVYTNIPIWLFCNLDNPSAKKLYERFGFQTILETSDKYGNQGIIMKKLPSYPLYSFLSGFHREVYYQIPLQQEVRTV